MRRQAKRTAVSLAPGKRLTWAAPALPLITGGTRSAHAPALQRRETGSQSSSLAARVSAWVRALASLLAAHTKPAAWGEDCSLAWAPGKEVRSGVTWLKAERSWSVWCRAVHALLRRVERAWSLPDWGPICLLGAVPDWKKRKGLRCLSRQLPERVRGGTAKLRWVL